MTQWFEDIVIDERHALGSHTFTEEQILRFGRLYDPQYYHTDPEAARHSHFGGLVASGWHTASVGHRLIVDALAAEEDRQRDLGREPGVSGPSPGVSAMAFRVPVRPGDTVTYELVVTGKRPSNSIPGWGLLYYTVTGVNQRGELVYKVDFAGFSKLRDYRVPLRLRLLQALTSIPGLRRLVAR
jgi:acyl dehydratase